MQIFNMDKKTFESWFSRDYNSSQKCFLCGKILNRNNSTKEHIFPQWILKEFDLYNNVITLLNGTTFPYRMAVIPCCNNCNNMHLSQLEIYIKNETQKGYEHFFRNVSMIKLYQWCQLIFYKILYKETFLKDNIKDSTSSFIISEDQFKLLSLNHLFLRSIDKKIEFKDFFPGSIFICNLKCSHDKSKNFDYFDSISHQCFGIRINDIGIIAVLGDTNLQKNLFNESYNDILNHILSPIQFKNLFAKCVFAQHNYNDPFHFEIGNITDESLTISIKFKEGISGNVYEVGNQDDYLSILASVFRCSHESFLLPNGKVGSLFYDKEGNWKDREFDDDGYVITKSS